MATILFVQDLMFEYLGPMYLSSYLKRRGHQVKVIVSYNGDNIIKKIKEIQPDIIAFSIMSTGQNWAFKMAKKIKASIKIPIIFGGAHPTFFPEMINYPFVDMICIGEGEEAIAELADKIDQKDSLTKIANIWVKIDDIIHKNPVRHFVEDLDRLPDPDRELYYSPYIFLKNISTKRFLASRGCPYNCTYCFNHKFKEIYQGKGRFVRWRSPDNIIQEIKIVRSKYPLKTVRFVDDTFTLNKKWLFELLLKYKEEINLPFTCLVRANEVNEELVKLLKEANCVMVTFGVETGSEELRNTVLGKNLKDTEIINAARLFKKYKIKFGTYNMICLPGETLDDAFKTLELNAKIRTDNPMCAIFQPFPKTKLTDYAIEQGLIEQNFCSKANLFEQNQLKIPNKKELINLHKLFMVGVWFPWTIPLIRRLVRLPNNHLFNLIFKVSYGIRSFKSYQINFFTAMRLGYKLRSRFYSTK